MYRVIARPGSLVLVERGAEGGTELRLPSRNVADRRRHGTELTQHLAAQESRRVLDAEPFERPLGEVAQHPTRLLVELFECRRRGRRGWRRGGAGLAPAFWRFPERRHRRQGDDERARRMLRVARDDTEPLERVQQSNRCLAHHGKAGRALVAAPRDDENFLDPFNLALPQPRLGARNGDFWRRQPLAEVKRSLLAEPRLVERLAQRLQSYATIGPAHGEESTARDGARQRACQRARRRAADALRGGAEPDAKILRKAHLMAGESPRAGEAVASNLLRIPRAVDALIADRR